MIPTLATYKDYCDHFATTCKACKGDKKVLKEGIWKGCGCQFVATIKWRFDKVQIDPKLKTLSWGEFDGILNRGCKEDPDYKKLLDPAIAKKAKYSAFEYCFGTKRFEALEDRKKNLCLSSRIGSGQNVVIVGDKQSGKTLLASLILKEVVYASLLFAEEYTFEWIRGYKLLDVASRLDDRPVDLNRLDELGSADFLFIDGLVAPKGYWSSLDRLVDDRMSVGLPTIVTCSHGFWEGCMGVKGYGAGHVDREVICKHLGDEIIRLMTDSRNLVINLSKGAVV